MRILEELVKWSGKEILYKDLPDCLCLPDDKIASLFLLIEECVKSNYVDNHAVEACDAGSYSLALDRDEGGPVHLYIRIEESIFGG